MNGGKLARRSKSSDVLYVLHTSVVLHFMSSFRFKRHKALGTSTSAAYTISAVMYALTLHKSIASNYSTWLEVAKCIS